MQHDAVDGAHVAPMAAHSTWAADPTHLPHIRAQTLRWLAPLALDHDTRNDLVLAVNEAASNAIEHAYPTPGPGDLVRVGFWTEPHHLCLEVVDDGRWRAPDPVRGFRGRGIPIMEQVVGSVSIHWGVDGTRVLLRHPTRW